MRYLTDLGSCSGLGGPAVNPPGSLLILAARAARPAAQEAIMGNPQYHGLGWGRPTNPRAFQPLPDDLLRALNMVRAGGGRRVADGWRNMGDDAALRSPAWLNLTDVLAVEIAGTARSLLSPARVRPRALGTSPLARSIAAAVRQVACDPNFFRLVGVSPAQALVNPCQAGQTLEAALAG